jgi:hypothetical protein
LASVTGWQVSAYALANPTPPGMHIFPGEIQYDAAMRRGHDDITFTVQAFVAYAADIGAQKNLDVLLAPSGEKSVKAALEADLTLGGLVDDLTVTESTGYRLADRSSGPLLTVGWTVEVMAPGGE